MCLQWLALVSFLGQPLVLSSSWIDTDGDSNGLGDLWIDQSGMSYTPLDLDAIAQDIDGDNATNEEERQYHSNPFVYDTDSDGLNDGDEIHLAIQQSGNNFSLNQWDSNGDGVSDHDQFYGFTGVTYSSGGLPNYPNATYYDYDGDGVKNVFDSYPYDPTNNDSDSDGIDDTQDPDANSALNYSYHNDTNWMGNALGDDDTDSILNFWDTYPNDSNNGSGDSDNDGVINEEDPFPLDHSNYSSTNSIYWFADLFADQDGDGILNYLDPLPYDAANGGSSGNSDPDGDGIINDQDPFPFDASNYSSSNGIAWHGDVLGDSDGDGNLNHADPWPYDPNNGTPPEGNPPMDSDGDNLTDDVDPFPYDIDNYSSTNSIFWGLDVLGNLDGDNLLNYEDPWPEDPLNGEDPPEDTDDDDDGIEDSLDPAPEDATNFSSINQIAWGYSALEDLDQDQTDNFHDPLPWNPYNNNADFDSDGLGNNVDPCPKDNENPSDRNNTSWPGSSAVADNDSDGLPNWWDATPNTFDDRDGDLISDHIDPLPDTWRPNEIAAISPHNGVHWPVNLWSDTFVAEGDADQDGNANYYDPDPFSYSGGEDRDMDGLPWPWDPDDGTPVDAASPHFIVRNGWSVDVNSSNSQATLIYFGDSDLDGWANHQDPYPFDPYNANYGSGYLDDVDGDGLSNSDNANPADPAPTDPSNVSLYNGVQWWSSPLADEDNDGVLNFYDPRPYESDNMDSDGDGFLDLNDPAPNHADNTSPINGLTWWGNLFGDDDHDGTQNFYDPTPQTPVDTDEDGLPDYIESTLGTSLNHPDSDDDGLTDAEEHNIYGTNPLDKHSESKARGWGTLYTDYQLADLTDTDQDQIPDRVEEYYGLNSELAADASADLDQNGITNLQQYLAGVALNAELGPNYDLDGDGLSDVYEDYYQQVLSRNTPNDAVADPDGDGVLNIEERLLNLRPDTFDTRGNGTALGDLFELMLSVRYPTGGNPPTTDANDDNRPDWTEPLLTSPATPDFCYFTRVQAQDLDGDGMPDLWEHQYGTWKHPENGLRLRVDDADGDNDGDGVPNKWEHILGTHPLAGDTDQNNVDDGDEDSDGDGLSNEQETAAGTKLDEWDSDGDGHSDGQELAEGTDPNSASSNSGLLLGLRVLSRIE